MRFSQMIKYCLSIPKTIYFNFRCFGFSEALKTPVIVSYKVKLRGLKRNIITIDSNHISRFMIKIGFNGTEEIAPRRAIINIESGKIIFKGECAISEGCTIGVSNGGIIEFGNGFSANKNFFISCNKHVTFGDDAMLGWNVTFFDANGHPIYKDGIKKEPFKSINVGKHVWICSEAHILKGSEIPDECIIAYGSLISSKLKEENSLYGGIPGKFLQDKIDWKRYND